MFGLRLGILPVAGLAALVVILGLLWRIEAIDRERDAERDRADAAEGRLKQVQETIGDINDIQNLDDLELAERMCELFPDTDGC